MNRTTGGAPTRGGGNLRPTVTRGVAAARRPLSVEQVKEFTRGVVLELRRVTWPTREEWIAATILTIALVVGIGLFTYLVDGLFTFVFNLIHA